MRTITIGRYEDPTSGYAGYIEGLADNGQSWIVYLDPLGRPDSYWAWCAPDGAVAGDPIPLIGPGIPLQDAAARAEVRPPLEPAPDPGEDGAAG
jgi:hypothetical protein